jgi:hypothetical protein
LGGEVKNFAAWPGSSVPEWLTWMRSLHGDLAL